MMMLASLGGGGGTSAPHVFLRDMNWGKREKKMCDNGTHAHYMHIQADAGHSVGDTHTQTHTHAYMQRKPHGSRPIKLLIREPVTDGVVLYNALEMALEVFT